MRSIFLHDHAHLAPEERARLERDIQSHRTLADLLAWCRARSPVVAVAEILTQDEYTHDIVVPLSERLVLVYDTT